eukprot:683185_1
MLSSLLWIAVICTTNGCNPLIVLSLIVTNGSYLWLKMIVAARIVQCLNYWNINAMQRHHQMYLCPVFGSKRSLIIASHTTQWTKQTEWTHTIVTTVTIAARRLPTISKTQNKNYHTVSIVTIYVLKYNLVSTTTEATNDDNDPHLTVQHLFNKHRDQIITFFKSK